MHPSRNTRGVVLLIAGVLLALAATRRRRFGVSRPSRIGVVAGVALALIGLRRILRSRQAWQSDFDAEHASESGFGSGSDFGWGSGPGVPSLGRRVEEAARSVRREVEQAANRVFG